MKNEMKLILEMLQEARNFIKRALKLCYKEFESNGMLNIETVKHANVYIPRDGMQKMIDEVTGSNHTLSLVLTKLLEGFRDSFTAKSFEILTTYDNITQAQATDITNKVADEVYAELALRINPST